MPSKHMEVWQSSGSARLLHSSKAPATPSPHTPLGEARSGLALSTNIWSEVTHGGDVEELSSQTKTQKQPPVVPPHYMDKGPG